MHGCVKWKTHFANGFLMLDSRSAVRKKKCFVPVCNGGDSDVIELPGDPEAVTALTDFEREGGYRCAEERFVPDENGVNGGVRLGAHDMFITEACEYVESFLTLRPTIALINNIDNDHLDYYGDMDHIVAAFKKFAALLPENGLLIGNTDDFRVRALMAEHTGRKLSYGMKDADYTPADITYDDNGCPGFDIMFRGEKLMHIQLQIPGEHSVMNAIAAAAVAREVGADDKCIASALSAFRNTRRRFEYYGERNGVKYYHDYGHHPSEIAATMKAASNVKHNKLFCVFQCNSYTRAKTLFLNDVTCFNLADETLVPDIYPGREKDDGSVHARDMVAAISKVKMRKKP